MISVDTNIVVRLLTRDDPAQARRAAALLRGGEIWLSKTVLLETEWVLRYTYEYEPSAIHEALQALTTLENLRMEDASSVETALEWHKAGMDFADALHLASSERGCTFATFDRKLVKVASSLEGTPPTKLV